MSIAVLTEVVRVAKIPTGFAIWRLTEEDAKSSQQKDKIKNETSGIFATSRLREGASSKATLPEEKIAHARRRLLRFARNDNEE